MGVFGEGGSQHGLIEVCDCSTEQQGALCVNLEKGGRGYVLNNHVGLEEGAYYQVSSTSMHWFGANREGDKKKTEGIVLQGSMSRHNDPYVLSLSLS